MDNITDQINDFLTTPGRCQTFFGNNKPNCGKLIKKMVDLRNKCNKNKSSCTQAKFNSYYYKILLAEQKSLDCYSSCDEYIQLKKNSAPPYDKFTISDTREWGFLCKNLNYIMHKNDKYNIKLVLPMVAQLIN